MRISSLNDANKDQAAAESVQCKLTVGSVNDPLEAEADAVADQVMRMPENAIIQRKCSHCEEEEAVHRKSLVSFIQRKQSGQGNNAIASDAVANKIQSSKGGGAPLESQTKSFMESRFGTDFSQVRIHSDDQAIQLSRDLNAQAFTVGSDIYFNSGKYVPESSEGKHLLAHELTHTVQQGGPHLQSKIQRQAAPAPRQTVWLNIGFDSSAQANEETMQRLRDSIAVERAAIQHCCATHGDGCNIDLRTHYDWVRFNKPAPADGDYDDDAAADRTLRDENLGKIQGPAGGLRILVTESTLSQTWQGARIFPRANTSGQGVLWNRALAATDTIAHEAGHAAGYVGDDEGGSHSSDSGNQMSPGNLRIAGAVPDESWCQQIAATAR